MPESTSYSFGDVVAVFSHELVGQKSVNGLGIGSITVAYTDNLTENDLGADGSTMITKVLSRRGTITLEIQQTSSLNKWLLNFANTVVNAASSYWADMLFNMQEKFSNGVTINASSLALLKRPDRKDEQNGGRVTWEFFSPTIAES